MWLQVCTNKMNLSDEVDLEDYIGRTDKISAAEISAICQEAGMQVLHQPVCVLFPLRVIQSPAPWSKPGNNL